MVDPSNKSEVPDGVAEQTSTARASLTLLYRHHYSWLLHQVRKRFGPDQAEDLVQETYLRASTYQGREIRNPRALLIQIATRAAIDRGRRAQVRAPFAGEPVEDLHVAADQAEALALKQTVLGLPISLREVFLLSRFGGLSYEEISERCGISVKTVEWRMSKALRICAKSLGAIGRS